MSIRAIVIALWVVTVVALLTGAARYRSERARLDALAEPMRPKDDALPAWPDSTAFRSALDRLNRSKLFGIVQVRSALSRDTMSRALSSVPQLQVLLHGIVGGPPWSAVISGLPGQPGPLVMRPGDSTSGVVVVRVTRDTAVLRHASGALTFTMKSP